VEGHWHVESHHIVDLARSDSTHLKISDFGWRCSRAFFVVGRTFFPTTSFQKYPHMICDFLPKLKHESFRLKEKLAVRSSMKNNDRSRMEDDGLLLWPVGSHRALIGVVRLPRRFFFSGGLHNKIYCD